MLSEEIKCDIRARLDITLSRINMEVGKGLTVDGVKYLIKELSNASADLQWVLDDFLSVKPPKGDDVK